MSVSSVPRASAVVISDNEASAHLATSNLRYRPQSSHHVQHVSETAINRLYELSTLSSLPREDAETLYLKTLIAKLEAMEVSGVSQRSNERDLFALNCLEVDLKTLKTDINANSRHWNRRCVIKISLLSLTTLVSITTSVAVMLENKDNKRPNAALVLTIALTALTVFLTISKVAIRLIKAREINKHQNYLGKFN